MPALAVDRYDKALGGNLVGGDPHTYHRALWDYLIERFALTSMLDIGCGEGHCVKYFSDAGVRAIGFDGLRTNIERAVIPIAYHDLRSGPFLCAVDLVHCSEVVEHIEAKFLRSLLRTLANGRVVAMTHALPGQTGYHHVNCQPAAYWMDRLRGLGYEFRPVETQEGKSRIEASGGWSYFLVSGLVFQRKTRG